MRRPWLRLALGGAVVGVAWTLASADGPVARHAPRLRPEAPPRPPEVAAPTGPALEPLPAGSPLGLRPVEAGRPRAGVSAREDAEVRPAGYRVTTLPAETKPVPAAAPADEAGYDHAPDHSWLVGELQYVHVRDAWRLRYAAADEDDRYGGCVTLAGVGRLAARLGNGQRVRVEGRLADPSSRDPSPAYRVHALRRLDMP